MKYNRRRYLCEECNTCKDNNKSLTYCFNECTVPTGILLGIESKEKTKREVEDKNDTSGGN